MLVLRRPRPLCLVLMLAGCGSAQSEVGSPEQRGRSPGEKCLDDAATPRDPGPNAPSRISASHILIRHADLARPAGATLSREDACLKALAALEAVNTSGDWNQAVDDFSDSGKSTHGDLGQISRDDVSPSFGNAAFALEIDELSYVVESDRGFHIILRTQ